MQTKLVILMIEKVLWGVVFIWVIILSPEWVRSKIPSHYLLLKLNTLLLVVVAPNFCDCKNFSLIMVFIKNILPSIVTISVPLTSLRILLGHMCFTWLRTYVMILYNWLILWQNAFYFYLGRLKICLNTSKNHISRSSVETFKFVQENKLIVQIH